MGPKKKSKLARSTSNARRMEITRALETPEDAQARLAVQQVPPLVLNVIVVCRYPQSELVCFKQQQ